MAENQPTLEAQAKMQPGAVWVAKRPGSRSANRIVQREGEGPGNGYCGPSYGVYYRTSSNALWCTHAAWDRWKKKQGAEFSHISPEHVR